MCGRAHVHMYIWCSYVRAIAFTLCIRARECVRACVCLRVHMCARVCVCAHVRSFLRPLNGYIADSSRGGKGEGIVEAMILNERMSCTHHGFNAAADERNRGTGTNGFQKRADNSGGDSISEQVRCCKRQHFVRRCKSKCTGACMGFAPQSAVTLQLQEEHPAPHSNWL